MGIKWENVKILRSPITNNIYLGKTDKSGMVATDKSSDRTEDFKAAVMGHMDTICKLEGTDSVTFECPAGELTWKKRVSE